MKGDSVGIWIWVIGGIVTASMLLLIAQTSLVQLGQQTSRQNVIQDFNGLNQDISSVCRQAPDSKKTREVKFPEVEAVFAAENRSEAPVESEILIAKEETSKGNHVCMSFEENHHGCVEHSCEVNMTYMGVPQESSEAYTLGEESQFTFSTTIEKKENGEVRVDGNIIP